MKKKVIVVLIIAIIIGMISVLLLNNTNTREVSLGEVFKVPLKRTVNVSDGLLKVKLLNVRDSRCMENFQCIWAGEISYQLSVNGKLLELGTVLKREVTYKNYNIVLDENNDSTKYVMIKIDEK